MDPITVADINAMSDEERANLNKKAIRHLAKFVLVKVAVTSAVVVGVHLAVKALENRTNETIETPTIEA